MPPETLEAPTGAAQDIFKGVDTFERANYEPEPKPVSQAPETVETSSTDPEDLSSGVQEPKTGEKKSKLDALGKVSRPQEKKVEEKAPEIAKEEEKQPEPKTPPELRNAYNLTKKEKQALQAELDKIKPDYDKIRKEFELTRNQLAELKALQLSDEERNQLTRLKEHHAVTELREDPKFQSEVLQPIEQRLNKIRNVIKEANLDPVAASALQNAMDNPVEFARNKEIRRIFKNIDGIEPDDMQDYINSMIGVGNDLQERLYPAQDAKEKSAMEISLAAKSREKQMAEETQAKSKAEFQKESDFVHKYMTEESLKSLLEDTDLSIEGTTLQQALKEAVASDTPRERALEMYSAAALPFVIQYANKMSQELFDLKEANKIRHGTAPRRTDGAPKETKPNEQSADPVSVFQKSGSFGG